MAANDAVSMNVAENRQNVPMAIQENRAAVPMVVAEGGGTPGGLNGKADKVTGAGAGGLPGSPGGRRIRGPGADRGRGRRRQLAGPDRRGSDGNHRR